MRRDGAQTICIWQRIPLTNCFQKETAECWRSTKQTFRSSVLPITRYSCKVITVSPALHFLCCHLSHTSHFNACWPGLTTSVQAMHKESIVENKASCTVVIKDQMIMRKIAALKYLHPCNIGALTVTLPSHLLLRCLNSAGKYFSDTRWRVTYHGFHKSASSGIVTSIIFFIFLNHVNGRLGL